MKNSYAYLFFMLLIICSTSCVKKDVYKLPKNAQELLAGSHGKTWKLAKRFNEGTRMNMAGCFLTYRITYMPTMIVQDNNGAQNNCGASLKAKWQFIDHPQKSYIKWTGDQIPEILKITKNYKYFKILQLTKDTLKLQHRHKQFSDKTTFVDVFVTESTEIKGRDFHW